MISFEATPLAPLPDVDWEQLARGRALKLDQALRPAFLAHGPAAENLARLLGGALCITTGQQPGLFTGPLFTLYKALSAISLARVAETALGKPVVPVFWVAGDDHDFAEANHCFVPDSQGDVQKIELRQRDAEAPLTPLYREVLGPDVRDAIARVRDSLPEGEFRNEVLAWLERHYRPETDFSTAFAGALAELLGPHGLVVFVANHPASKRVIAPWIRRALADAGPLDQALAAHADRLAAGGKEVPVSVGDGATLVMLESNSGRDRLVVRDSAYIGRRSGEQWKQSQLVQLLEREPERFSPNVLLRPVVEAAILPTLAYAGGPGELAYLEQTAPVYGALGVVPQARIPRWSGRALEARVQRALEKYGLTADELGQQGSRLETELLREEIPGEARAAMEALRAHLDREYQAILSAAVTIDPTLQRPAESARNAALAGITDLEKRMVSHLKKKKDVVTSQLSRARTSLFPQGEPQERVLSPVSFLGRYGPVFVDLAAAAAVDWYQRPSLSLPSLPLRAGRAAP
jgi:bacillithiol synthase